MITGGTNFQTAPSSLFMSNYYLKSAGMDQKDIYSACPVVWVMGAHMMIRCDVLDEVGMLDENLLMYGEEADICYRATRAGWVMWYTPAGVTIHPGGQSTKQIDLRKTTDWAMTTSYYFFRKHGGRLYALWLFVVNTCLCLIKSVLSDFAALGWRVLLQAHERRKLLDMVKPSRWRYERAPWNNGCNVAGFQRID
jgi:GT2 family glycosyltransferase